MCLSFLYGQFNGYCTVSKFEGTVREIFESSKLLSLFYILLFFFVSGPCEITRFILCANTKEIT